MSTTSPDWQARAIAFAEAYAAWARTVANAIEPILEQLRKNLQPTFDLRLPQVQVRTSYRRVQRSYRRDLHRAYRRRYHQRPPLRRASS